MVGDHEMANLSFFYIFFLYILIPNYILFPIKTIGGF